MDFPRRRPSVRTLALVAGLGLALALAVASVAGVGPLAAGTPQTTSLTALREDVAAGRVASVEVDNEALTLTATLDDGSQVQSGYVFLTGDELLQEFAAAGVEVSVVGGDSGPWLTVLLMLVQYALLGGLLLWVLRRQGVMGNLAAGKRTPVQVPATRFDDVIGADETVAELAEVVDFLHDPARYAEAGARMPRGFLFVGPPGTGKTLLARALAGQAQVPFFSVSGTDFVEMYVGRGAARVRDLFAEARRHPAAIVFIDEIDAVGRARGAAGGAGGEGESERTLNALLVEMDGFTAESGVVVVAATNRVDVLDPALLRPGRFDRQVPVGLPDRRARERMLALHAQGKRVGDDVDYTLLARRTAGMSGAQIAQLVNEAALEQVRSGAQAVHAHHFAAALATVALGKERRGAVVTDHDQAVTAWHEAGHTVAALLVPGADAPVSVTVAPRGPSGGSTWMAASDDAYLTRSRALARLTVAMAGRAAEMLLLDGDYTQGAAGDLESATRTATAMVATYGMGGGRLAVAEEHTLGGPVGVAVDEAVNTMLQQALDRARALLAGHRDLLQAVAEALLEEETLEHAALARLAAVYGVGPVNSPHP